MESKRGERFIGNSLEAKVILFLPDRYKTILSEYGDFLPTFFIVSAAELADNGLDASYKSEKIEGLEVRIERAPGAKCQRCWNWRETVGKSEEAPEICDRCYNVLFE